MIFVLFMTIVLFLPIEDRILQPKLIDKHIILPAFAFTLPGPVPWTGHLRSSGDQAKVHEAIWIHLLFRVPRKSWHERRDRG